jgi:O-antigen ligase
MGLLILTLPVSLITLPQDRNNVILILVLSFIGLILNRERLTLSKWEKYFIFSFVFYFAVIAINLWWFDGYLRDLDTPSRLILVLPIYFFIRKSDISANWLLWGIVIGAIVSGLIKLDISDTIFFSKIALTQSGTFSLFSSIFGLSSVMFFRKDGTYIKNSIFLIAFIFGVWASLISGGRGVWISAVLSLLVIIFINPMNWSGKIKSFIFFLFLANFIGAYFVPETGVKNRIDNAKTNIASWVVDGTSNTSAGARLEMWKASFEVIKENPIIGVGEDNYKKHQKELIDQGKISKFVGKFAHPHGEYITSLVEQGGIGLLAFILVLLMPIKYFLNHIKSKLYTNESTILVTPGLIIILHYLFYSVTSGVFDHQSTALFYSVFMAIIIGLIKSNSRIEV